MVLPALLAVTVLVAPGDFATQPRSARLLDAQLDLAQAQTQTAPLPDPTPPPLVDMPEDGAPEAEPWPTPNAAPAPNAEVQGPSSAPPSDDLLPVDRYANSVNPAEMAAAAATVLVVDGLILVGTLVSIVMIVSQDPGLTLVGLVGVIGFPALGIVAAPLAAASVARAVSPKGYAAGSYGKAVLYGAAVHLASLLAYVLVSSVSAYSNSGQGGPDLGWAGGSLILLRWVGMGAAASYGLHQGPASPAMPMASMAPVAAPTGFPRVVGVPVFRFRF